MTKQYAKASMRLRMETQSTMHDDEIDALLREPEELVKFGARCQLLSSLIYDVLMTGDVDDSLMTDVREFRRTEENESARRWIRKTEVGLGNVMYMREHCKQSTLGGFVDE